MTTPARGLSLFVTLPLTALVSSLVGADCECAKTAQLRTIKTQIIFWWVEENIVLLRWRRRRRKLWVEDGRDAVRYLSRIGARLVSENYDREFVVNVARDLRLKSLPRAAVFDQAMPAHDVKRPAEAVRIGLSI